MTGGWPRHSKNRHPCGKKGFSEKTWPVVIFFATKWRQMGSIPAWLPNTSEHYRVWVTRLTGHTALA
jgi:hypothetical protein